MQQLTPGALIDELRATLHMSEQRRQRAEARLADCDRRLGTASAIIAAQDQQIADLRAAVACLTAAAARPADNVA
jgi:chromosome segregation ATPase